jgi:hypothetical protein
MYRKLTQQGAADMPQKKGASGRELLDTGTDKRYVRRENQGVTDQAS